MIISGDFNRVIATSDTTGHYNHSRALAELIYGFALKDTWQQNPTKPTYTLINIRSNENRPHLHYSRITGEEVRH